ncbi:polysaccharide pyruvyl transferase family protein [Yeosuana marina]|uniref:polysaccharide pyruvyl transferase family protein n=1 Tax=Yeosuana marina TaxID=1565536 RepID=UPI0030C88BED
MKILMFFHGGSGNRGCEAIVRSGVAIIKKNNPEYIVDLASWKPETDKIIPLLDNIILDKNREFKPGSFAGLISALKVKFFNDESMAFRKKHEDIIKRIPDYDLFLSIGGDNYCYGEQPGIYEIDRCIKKAGKKLVLWGASIGEEDLSPEKIEDFKLFDLILARETLTQAVLESKGLTNVKLCADGAFTMEKEEMDLPDGWQDNNTIGFNYSPLVYKKNKASRVAANSLIKHILDTTDMTICFTPHVIQKNNDDHELLMEFYNEYKATARVIILPNNLNATQYKGYIGRMRFFIGARTHATIAAYSTLVPTMVLGYSIKSKGIAKDIFGSQKLVLSLDEISNSTKLKEKFNELINEEAILRKMLQENIPNIKKMAYKAGIYLSEV